MKKTIKTTIFALATIILFSGLFATNDITTEAAKKSTKTTTKTSTKRNTKVVKLKKRAKKKTSKKVSTKRRTKKYNKKNAKVTQRTTVRKTTVTKFTAKVKRITTTTKTTVKTTTVTTLPTAKNAAKQTTTNTSKTNTSGNKNIGNASGNLNDNNNESAVTFNINNLEGTADANVIKALRTLNYKVTLNSSASYAGKFDARSRQIILRSANKGYFLHELGHFVSFVAGFKDSTAEFVGIFNREAGKYAGNNATYITKDSKEYFAESYKDYVNNPSALKSTRPETYNYIKSSVESISDNKVAYINAVYYGA